MKIAKKVFLTVCIVALALVASIVPCFAFAGSITQPIDVNRSTLRIPSVQSVIFSDSHANNTADIIPIEGIVPDPLGLDVFSSYTYLTPSTYLDIDTEFTGSNTSFTSVVSLSGYESQRQYNVFTIVYSPYTSDRPYDIYDLTGAPDVSFYAEFGTGLTQGAVYSSEMVTDFYVTQNGYLHPCQLRISFKRVFTATSGSNWITSPITIADLERASVSCPSLNVYRFYDDPNLFTDTADLLDILLGGVYDANVVDSYFNTFYSEKLSYSDYGFTGLHGFIRMRGSYSPEFINSPSEPIATGIDTDPFTWFTDLITNLFSVELFGSITIGTLLITVLCVPAFLLLLRGVAGG